MATKVTRRKYTARDVAEWMHKQVKTGDYFYQETCVYEIMDRFGEEFTYDNENFNKAIRKDVLAEFRRLTKDTVVWSRDERYWRLREEFDEDSRAQE